MQTDSLSIFLPIIFLPVFQANPISRRRFIGTTVATAGKLVATGEAEQAENLQQAAHAAWTTVCLLVLNLDETLTR